MRIIIQKYGGTSVATPELRAQVAERIITAKTNGGAPVVVVSAMGREGDPYATDTLISLLKAIGATNTLRDKDLLLACGEIISGVLMAEELRSRGFPAVALTGGQAGIITDDHFGNANIVEVRTERLLSILDSGQIAVVAGFQGVTASGDLTTLGRGGSDTTAAVLGAALHAEVIEFYKDVDGIMTADPKLVPAAKRIDAMAYEELFQLANQGAKVIHPRAVEIAMENRLPLRVKCTFRESPGTLITNQETEWLSSGNGDRKRKTVTGVTYLTQVAQIKVVMSDRNDKKMEVRLFKELAGAGVSIDLINVFPEQKVFTVNNSEVLKAAEIIRRLGLAVETAPECAKVSIVGAGMRGIPGVMADFVEALDEAGVEILQTADSHLTISALVRQADLGISLRALHGKYGLG